MLVAGGSSSVSWEPPQFSLLANSPAYELIMTSYLLHPKNQHSSTVKTCCDKKLNNFTEYQYTMLFKDYYFTLLKESARQPYVENVSYRPNFYHFSTKVK